MRQLAIPLTKWHCYAPVGITDHCGLHVALVILPCGMAKETKEKESQQNIRYLGFETTADGGRRFDFSITAKGLAPVRVRLDIPGSAFTGLNRITFQESAKICYEKLRAMLEES